MSELTNDIVLRPRFQIEIEHNIDVVQQLFDDAPTEEFDVKRLDEHIYIKFKKTDINFWSPQLHLELTSFEKGITKIHGVFGPNPTLWTFFMFLHFGVGTLFVILGVFAYSNYSLGHDVTFWLVGMFFLVVLWFTLYAFGRMGRAKGKPQMEMLKTFFRELLGQIKKS